MSRRPPRPRGPGTDDAPIPRGGPPGSPVHPEFRCALRHSGVVAAARGASSRDIPVKNPRVPRPTVPFRGGTVRAEGEACFFPACRPRARCRHDVEGSRPERADAARCSCVCSRRIAAPASGQSSRAEVIAQQEAAKAKKLAPPTPNKAEALVGKVEEILLGVSERLLSVLRQRVERRRLHARRRLPAVHAATTPSSTSRACTRSRTTSTSRRPPPRIGLAGGKVNMGAHLGWRDATQVAYYGVGIDTPPEDRSNYRFKQGWVSGDIVAKPAWWTVFGANIGYEDFSLESGTGHVALDRRDLHARHGARPRPQPDVPALLVQRRHRHAALTRLRAPRHLHRGPLPQLRRSGRRPELRPARRRDHPAHPLPA